LFSGVAYCADCGAKLYFYTRSIKNKWGTRYEGSYSCSEYRKDVQYQGNRKCTCHFIRESQLEQLVLEELRQLLRYIPKHEKQFAKLVMDRSAQEQKRDTAAKKRSAAKHRQRIAELDTLTPAIVHEFIDRIIVHEPEQARGDRRQKVEIIYNNIGAVDRLALMGLGA